MLAACPLGWPGLLRYWVDSEGSGEVHSLRYSGLGTPGDHPLVSVGPPTPYLPEALVDTTLTALQSQNILQIKSALHLVDLAGGQLIGSVRDLLLAFTHPSSCSVFKLNIVRAISSVLHNPHNFHFFMHSDITQGLDAKTAHTHFGYGKAKKENQKKLKTEEDGVYTSGYQVMLAHLKKPFKLANAIKALLNKAGLFELLERLQKAANKLDEGVLPLLDTVRKHLKLQLLQTSTVHMTKHEFLVGRLTADFTQVFPLSSQLVLGDSLSVWLAHTRFLRNLLLVMLHSPFRESPTDFRTLFIAVADIFLTLVRSRGGVFFLSQHKRVVLHTVAVLEAIEGPQEPGEVSLLEEEYLLGLIPVEKVAVYAKQLSAILRAFLKLSEIVATLMNQDSGLGLKELYCYLNSLHPDFPFIPHQAFYTICRLHPQVFDYVLQQIDPNSEIGMIKSFYGLEIAAAVLKEDRNAELILLRGNYIREVLGPLAEINTLFKKQTDLVLEWAGRRNLSIDSLIEEVKESGGVKSDSVAGKKSHLPIGGVNDCEVEIGEFGLMSESGSKIIPLSSALRTLNSVISTSKGVSVQLVSKGFLTVLSNLVGKVTYILHTLYLCPFNTEAFVLDFKNQRKTEHFELLLPCFNMLNIILEQLLATNLLLYNNSYLLENIVHVFCISDLILSKQNDITVHKVSRLIKTTLILWGQEANFTAVYLPVVLEHAFQYPFKASAVMNLLGGLFEHYISYKDPSFGYRCLSYLMQEPAPVLFSPQLMYYYLMKAENTEAEDKILKTMMLKYEDVKDRSSRKYEARQVWETKQVPSLLHSRNNSILKTLLKGFIPSNSYDLNTALLRLLRCIAAVGHLEGTQTIVETLVGHLEAEEDLQAKALWALVAVTEVPIGKAVCLKHSRLIVPFLRKHQVLALRIYRNLLDPSIGDDLDLPQLVEIQNFLLELRPLLSFYVPGMETNMSVEEEEDDLYGEFVEPVNQQTGCDWEFTFWALKCTLELSKHEVGKSVIQCGQFPYDPNSPPSLDFSECLNRLSLALQKPEMFEKVLALTELMVQVLKETSSAIVPKDSLEKLKLNLESFKNKRVENVLELLKKVPESAKPSSSSPKDPKELSQRFTKLTPEYQKIKEFQKNVKKSHKKEVVEGKRAGEKLEVKPIQFLTDLVPPPYPPLFKFKGDLKSWWTREHQEFIPEVTLEKMQAEEERHRSQQVPQMLQYPRMYSMQSNFSDAERNALQELMQLLQRKDRSHDPRLQLRIEHLLTEHPNLCEYISSRT